MEKAVEFARALWGVESGFLASFPAQGAPAWVASGAALRLKRAARALLAQKALLDRLRRQRRPLFWGDCEIPLLLVPIPQRKTFPFTLIGFVPGPGGRPVDLAAALPLAELVADLLEGLGSGREREEALARLSRLYRIVSEISAEQRLLPLLGKIVEGGLALLGLDSGGLSLWDAARQCFVVKRVVNMPAGLEGSTYRMGEGVGGMAARMEKTIVLNPEAASAEKRIRRAPYQVIIGAPLRRGDRMIGAFTFQSKSPKRKLSERDCLLLEALAHHAAIAIENAQSLDSRRGEVAGIETLRRVGVEIGAELNRARLSERILRLGLALSGLQAGWIALWDSAAGCLKVEGGVDLPAGWIGKKIKPGEGVLGRAVQQRKVVQIGQRREGDPLVSELRQFSFEVAIAVPLIWQGKVLGGLYLGTGDAHRRISAEERKTLESFSEHAAVALSNAERYDALQREGQVYQKALETRTEELSLLREENSRKEKLAALGQIVGSVNHELRQPLEVITNAVYYLRLQLERGENGPLKQEFGRFLTIINDECRAATDLVNELLDFTRKKEAVSIRVDLNQLMENLLGRIQVPDKVRIKADFSRRTPFVFIDPIQVSRALSNFVINGIQAMTQGGTLRVATRLGRQSVELSIEDTGEGIAPENMERLFQPLFTTKARGVGLGLPLAKQYIEANRGRIDVESKVGVGTTFRVSFPRLQNV